MMKTVLFSDHTFLSYCFQYLDSLRESGETNMYGARPYLMEYCEIEDRDLALKVLKAWSKTFNSDDSPETRASVAISTNTGATA